MTIIETSGWTCLHCEQPVELVAPGAWWRHDGPQGACEFRLMDDAYNADEDRYYQSDDEEDDDVTYKIIRFRFNGDNEFVKGGLTLDEAQAHCQDEATHGDGWFDGYEEER